MQGEDQLFDALREKRNPDATRILQNIYIHASLRDSSETPLLLLVVATQDLSLLQALLPKPDLEIDAKDTAGRTALTVAITTGNVKAAIALLQAGASVDFVDKNLRASTPALGAALRQAASTNDDSTVAQLLRLGVSCSLANEGGATALHMAAAHGHASILTTLLQEVRDNDGINTPNHSHPFLSLLPGGHADAVEALILGNASMHCVSNTDATLLHAAVLGGNTSVLDQLFLFCSDAKDVCDEMGQTPLHVAAAKNLVNAVKYLVKAKANVVATTITGKTPLMLATDRRVIAILQQAQSKGKLKKTLLSDAELDQLVDRICSSEVMLNKLVERICNRLDVGLEVLKNSVDRPEGTQSANARVQAVYVNDASQERTLVTDDRDSNAANEAGDSPLHLAVQANDHKTLMSLLRTPSIQVDVHNAAGVTPMVLAIQMGHRHLATMLQTAAQRTIPSVLTTVIKMDQSSPIYGTMYRCNSPYVQELLAVSGVGTTSPKLVLEYMDAGDLRSYLDAKRLGEPTKVNVSPLQVAWVIANALADLHNNSVFHHDLESYNVLLSSTNYIKVLALTSNYSFAADIYSFGVILTELDTLQMPFHDVKGLGYWGIIDGVRLGNLRPTVSASCPQWLRDLANACLSFDPTQRPSAQKIVELLQNLVGRSKEEAPAVVTPASFLAPKVSTTASNGKLLSTRVVCQLCQTSSSLLQTHCEGCAEELAPAASKIKVLLKRLLVAKKNGLETYDGLVVCEEELPTDIEKLRILILRIEQATKSTKV
ncbi:TKL protein kinase [Saprolegnia parasitica CBS 223.65]|uniref:TKL protein kinase n=1 Tax=Saprolegnia parasitica (strain CBS 223.65) TaxID=695850 RepID=A0A067BWI0_SAPPC|nr:TKL protein kinase [Saprolegnia parasitica CBS 223.65]KDO22633.1 TKL protein kinase [Saprolegnia parasitica CBS 223.65]|eukprot:XP_012206669.1 TKL protein kinase [Saprolegnia parasitica CBS 223.65]